MMDTYKLFSFSLLLGILCCFLIPQTIWAGELHLLSAAGLRQPVDRVVNTFQKTTKFRVYVDYGGSGVLLSRIVASGRGDIYMPADFYYIEKLKQKGYVHSFQPIVSHIPVIGVNHGKKHTVHSLRDLTKPGLRLAMGDPKAMAFGRIAMGIMEKSGLKNDIQKNIVVYGATVKQLAMYVAQGDVDAAIIGRADAFQYPKRIGIVTIPPVYFDPITVAIAVLKSSKHIDLARTFSDYLSSKPCIDVYIRFGFLPLQEVSR